MQRNAGTMKADLRAQERSKEELSAEPLPFDPAVYIERCQVHGDDPSREHRESAASELLQIHNDLSAMRQNPTANAAQIEIEAAKKVRERVEAREVLFDVQRRILLRKQGEVESEIEAALQPKRSTWAALAPELRTALRTMPEEQRYQLIQDVKGTDDFWPVAHAIVSAPAALSGVAAGKHMELRNVVLAVRNPDLLHSPANIARRIALHDKCVDGYRRSIPEFVDFNRADALKRLAGGSA